MEFENQTSVWVPDFSNEEDGPVAKDSIGIKVKGKILEGLMTPMDDRQRSTARANPLEE